MTERARCWQRLVAEWSGSGQTQAAFCRQRRIELWTSAWWKRQLRQKGLVAAAPVRSGPESGGPQASAGFDERELARLLGVPEKPC